MRNQALVDNAERQGDRLAKGIGKLKYYAWTGNDFDQVHGLPSTDHKDYDKEVRRLRSEQAYLDLLYEYKAYILAPTEEDRQIVVEFNFQESRRKMNAFLRSQGTLTDGKGFLAKHTSNEKIEYWKAYKHCFELICSKIEKELIKSEKRWLESSSVDLKKLQKTLPEELSKSTGQSSKILLTES